MQLLNPYAIAWLPLIALLLLVARHRAPRPRRAVANLYLWRQTTPLDPARFALARFRRHRLLALQIAFMLAVIAALARPIVTGAYECRFRDTSFTSCGGSGESEGFGRTDPCPALDAGELLPRTVARDKPAAGGRPRAPRRITVRRGRVRCVRQHCFRCRRLPDDSRIGSDAGAGGTRDGQRCRSSNRRGARGARCRAGAGLAGSALKSTP